MGAMMRLTTSVCCVRMTGAFVGNDALIGGITGEGLGTGGCVLSGMDNLKILARCYKSFSKSPPMAQGDGGWDWLRAMMRSRAARVAASVGEGPGILECVGKNSTVSEMRCALVVVTKMWWLR